MRIHELKCRDVFFEQILSGEKSFEVRKKDRCFNVGDFLALNEITSEDGEYTSRSCVVKVCSILDDPEFCKPGYVVMGIQPASVSSSDTDPMFGDRLSRLRRVPLWE